jgi:competence protein ComEA
VKKAGTVTKTEKMLLGITAVFLCGLLALSAYDRQAMKTAGVVTEVAAAQEEVLGNLTPVDLNTASEEELAELPGIGPELARRVVDYREEHGFFRHAEEIMEVSGIGEKKFEDMKDRIVVEVTE